MNLEKSRREIDEIDAEIVTLLNRRALIVKLIGEHKSRSGMPISDGMREGEVIKKVVAESCGLIDDGSIERIYSEILAESRRIQSNVAAQNINNEVLV